MFIAQGQVQRIQTMMDGSVRMVADIPKEAAPDNLLRWQFETVALHSFELAKPEQPEGSHPYELKPQGEVKS